MSDAIKEKRLKIEAFFVCCMWLFSWKKSHKYFRDRDTKTN